MGRVRVAYRVNAVPVGDAVLVEPAVGEGPDERTFRVRG